MILISLIIVSLIFSGCIEVTPSSGSTNTTAYGLNKTGGNLTSSLESRTPTPGPTSPDGSLSSPANSQINNTGNQVDGADNPITGPNVKIPQAPVSRVLPATPKSYEGFPTPIPTRKPSITTQKPTNVTIVSIYKINQSFKNNATGFLYPLSRPPMTIDLKFKPEMGSDVIAFQKRTGDKEGDVKLTVVRPLKDAWFEIRVYDNQTGALISTEGYGKSYSVDNKSVVIRSAGTYQFDCLGNDITTEINFTITVPESELSQYNDIINQMTNKSAEAGKIPGVFLVLGDLPAGWKVVGDVIRTETTYQSMFNNEGTTLKQKIIKFSSSDLAIAELEKQKTAAGSDASGATLIGQKGFVVDMAQVKTRLMFVQDLYLVELSCFTPPNPIPVSELQKYGQIVINKIHSTG